VELGEGQTTEGLETAEIRAKGKFGGGTGSVRGARLWSERMGKTGGRWGQSERVSEGSSGGKLEP